MRIAVISSGACRPDRRWSCVRPGPENVLKSEAECATQWLRSAQLSWQRGTANQILPSHHARDATKPTQQRYRCAPSATHLAQSSALLRV